MPFACCSCFLQHSWSNISPWPIFSCSHSAKEVSESSRVTWMLATCAASPLTQLKVWKCLLTSSGCTTRFKLPWERAEFLADKRGFKKRSLDIQKSRSLFSRTNTQVFAFPTVRHVSVTGGNSTHSTRKLCARHTGRVCGFWFLMRAPLSWCCETSHPGMKRRVLIFQLDDHALLKRHFCVF